MNVAAHQEEKNEETGKRKEGGERKQADFKGLHGEKMLCVRGVPGVTGTLGKTKSNFNPTQTGLGTAPPR